MPVRNDASIVTERLKDYDFRVHAWINRFCNGPMSEVVRYGRWGTTRMVEYHFSALTVRAKNPVGSICDMSMADARVALMIGNSVHSGAADLAGSASDAAAAADTQPEAEMGLLARANVQPDGSKQPKFRKPNAEQASISANGRYVTYSSKNTKIVHKRPNYAWQVFRFDTKTRQTVLVSVTPDGTPGSADSGEASGTNHEQRALPSITHVRERVDLLMQMTRPVRQRLSTSQLAVAGFGSAGMTLSSSSRVGVRVIERIRL